MLVNRYDRFLKFDDSDKKEVLLDWLQRAYDSGVEDQSAFEWGCINRAIFSPEKFLDELVEDYK